MKLTLRQMQQAVVLAEHAHFGRAAEALHISQPALTRGIQGLEEKLGTRLFSRSPAGASLTDAGRVLVGRARAILADCTDLERHVDELVSTSETRLTVAAGHYPAELSVVDAVADMLAAAPELSVGLRAVDWRECLELLMARSVEIAVCEFSELPEGPGLGAEPLGRHRVHFLARPGHPLLSGGTLTIERILAFPWSCSPLPARALRAFPPVPTGAGSVAADEGVFLPAVQATSLPLTLRLAAKSDALAIGPLCLAQNAIEDGSLVPVPFSAPWLRLNYGIVWSERRPPGGAALELMARLRRREKHIARREARLAARFGITP